MMIHSKANRDDCPQMNDGNKTAMAIIENYHFKAMAHTASNPRLLIVATYDVGQFGNHNEAMTAELCPDCTAVAKAVKPGFLP